MAGFFKQLRLLMWKNLVLYVRRPCTLVFEIGFPIFYACIMLAIRALISRDRVDSSTYYNSSDLHLSSIYPTNMEIGYVPDYTNTESVMSDVVTNFNTYSGTSGEVTCSVLSVAVCWWFVTVVVVVLLLLVLGLILCFLIICGLMTRVQSK